MLAAIISGLLGLMGLGALREAETGEGGQPDQDSGAQASPKGSVNPADIGDTEISSIDAIGLDPQGTETLAGTGTTGGAGYETDNDADGSLAGAPPGAGTTGANTSNEEADPDMLGAIIAGLLGLVGIIAISDSGKGDDTPPVQEPTDEEPTEQEQEPELEAIHVVGPEVVAGRVTVMEPEDADEVESLRIVEGPEAGNVSVNPDNSLAVVLSDPDTTGSVTFSYEVTYKDGTVELIENESQVAVGTQADGWGQGEFYMLATDENGDVIVETGEEHRPVYVSGSDDALSRADIAALEGLDVTEITDRWLVDNPDYGGSEEMALDTEAGMAVWYATTYADDRVTSNWLLFEKGYTYTGTGRLIDPAVSGEDELHPLHVTSYGEGELPVIDDFSRIYQMDSHNIVFSDVQFGDMFQSLSGHNVIFEDVVFGAEAQFQFNSGLTIRDSMQYGLSRDEPSSGGDYYHPHVDRIAGMFFNASDGVLLEGNLWDQIGWVDGYSFDGLAENGQAPSAYSQNVYVQNTVFDLTFRDNITMRAASFGAQLRGGGFVEDNLFLENNAAVNFMGGDYQGAGPIGNYTLFTGNVTTSGQHNNAAQIGALTYGVDNGGLDTTLYHNVIAHLADPNNPDELAEKEFTHRPLTDGDEAFYNDTVIYNWVGTRDTIAGVSNDLNTESLNTDLLDQTTIQIYAAQLLDDPDATIADLADYLRAQTDNDTNGVSNADIINAFFLQNFGFGTEARLDAATLRFVPNELADGTRWDNRLNWDTEDLPGTIDGDSVDLAGNFVRYGGTNQIENLDFGNGGKLTVDQGKLTVDGTVESDDRGATLDIAKAGQVWINGYSDQEALDLNIDGGRFVNNGTVDGTTDTTITDGQAILATDGATFDVSSDSSLTIEGSEARVGFDGDGGDTAVLRFEDGAKLSFVADEDGFSAIGEFRSGHYGDAPDLQSGVNLNDVALQLDITGLDGANGSFTLAEVDALVGGFSKVELIGLDETQEAELVIDYETDTLTLNLFEAGTGTPALELSTTGTDDDSVGAALWAALTDGMPPLADTDEDEEDELELLVL